jgi:hypothetical protein
MFAVPSSPSTRRRFLLSSALITRQAHTQNRNELLLHTEPEKWNATAMGWEGCATSPPAPTPKPPTPQFLTRARAHPGTSPCAPPPLPRPLYDAPPPTPTHTSAARCRCSSSRLESYTASSFSCSSSVHKPDNRTRHSCEQRGTEHIRARGQLHPPPPPRPVGWGNKGAAHCCTRAASESPYSYTAWGRGGGTRGRIARNPQWPGGHTQRPSGVTQTAPALPRTPFHHNAQQSTVIRRAREPQVGCEHGAGA